MRVGDHVKKWALGFGITPFCLLFLAMPASGEPVGSALVAEEMALLGLYFSDEQLVEVATRHPKPISQVAENVTVITAAEIEAMQASTVAEVLERVPGIFILFRGRDFASPASISVHGSDYEHVLVLVDGIRWNSVGADFPETIQIPVEIIDRIEVIKGAASSAWGSALGGVVNILTKEPGRTGRPSGSAVLAVGERGSRRFFGELTERLDGFSYYLFAGRRQSDGIRDSRFFEDTNLFGKFSHTLSSRTRLSGEIGYSQPEYRYLHLEARDMALEQDHRLWFYSAFLDSSLASDLHFHLQIYSRENRTNEVQRAISTDTVQPSNRTYSFDEEQQGVNSRLAREIGPHTLVLGAEYLHRQVNNRAPARGLATPTLSEQVLAGYLNNTFRLGNFTVTPGLRYDRLSIGDNQVSPSLGATYQLNRDNIFRAAATRGFRKPTLDLKETPAGTSVYEVTANPELESEIIRTYQAGFETRAIHGLWLQTTVFRHETEDTWIWDDSGAIVNDGGKLNRTGLEAALRTAPVRHFSLGANYALVREKSDIRESDKLYKINLLLEYQNRDFGLLTQLFGNYVQWDDVRNVLGETSTFIWDLSLRQRILRFAGDRKAEFFLKVHNLFNDDHYWHFAYPNAPRWLEAGLHLHF